MQSCIYEGRVEHRRESPVVHGFGFSLALAYLDLQEVEHFQSSHRARKSFAPAARGLLSRFRRRDHFGQHASLSRTVKSFVRRQTGEEIGGPIRLLAQLPSWGYVFNPISLYFCYDTREELSWIVAEVRNTPWLERHCYLLRPNQWQANGREQPLTLKAFHVSPFMPMDMHYRWRINPPGEQLGVRIENLQRSDRVFQASMQLTRREISPASVRRLSWRYPLQPQRVTAMIYWQALRLWRKRVPYHPHPAAAEPTSATSPSLSKPNSRIRPENTPQPQLSAQEQSWGS